MGYMKPHTEPLEGPEAFKRFGALVSAVLAVPHSEIVQREAEYRKRSEANPRRRGPKRKVKPSASSGRVAGLHIRVHIARLAADEGPVTIHLASQLATVGFILHGKPDSMEHEPRGFLGHIQGAMELPGGDAVTVGGDQPHCRKPLVQADWRGFADR